MSGQGGEWLWPADRETQIYHLCEQRGTRKGILGLTINTARPLLPQHLTQTLHHLLRRMPNLQVVLRLRGGKLWYYRPATQSPEFQVLEDEGDLAEICTKVAQQGFSYSDDVFCRARLVPRGAHVPCPIPEIRPAYPHQYDAALYIHHCLGDGLDGGVLAQCLADVLVKVLAGEAVDDTPWGVYTSKEDVETLKEEMKQKMLSDPERTNAVRRTLPPPHHKPLLLQIGEKPKVSQPTTRHVTRILEQQLMSNFQQKAKYVGISFNSGLVAAINTALVNLARAAGLDQNSFTITLGMHVTLRHYLPKSSIHHFGPYNSHVTHCASVSRNVKDEFWDYAGQLHKELWSGIRSRLALEQEAVRNMDQPVLSPEESVTRPNPPQHDYCVTNLGDLSSGLNFESKDIKVTNAFSYNIIHNYHWSNFHQLLVYLGKTYYTISYDTQYLTDDTANRFIDEVVSTIRETSSTTDKTTTRSKM